MSDIFGESLKKQRIFEVQEISGLKHPLSSQITRNKIAVRCGTEVFFAIGNIIRCSEISSSNFGYKVCFSISIQFFFILILIYLHLDFKFTSCPI